MGRLPLSLVGADHPHEERVVAVRGDIGRPGLGIRRGGDELAERVSEIVHGAASVSFQLGQDARAVNVEGTRRMLKFAERCQRRGGLRRFSYISTAFVAGEHVGHFSEDELDVGEQLDLLRWPLRAVTSPSRVACELTSAIPRVTQALAHSLRPALASPLNTPLSPSRRLAWAHRPLDDLRKVKRVHGTTVNDVLLAAVAGGVHKLAGRGERCCVTVEAQWRLVRDSVRCGPCGLGLASPRRCWGLPRSPGF